MKYFILSLLAVAVLVVGIFGLRGQKFSQTPIEIFPDMDRMDFVQGQQTSSFFKDGLGSRLPVGGTVVHSGDDGLFPVEFGEGRTGHYYSGGIDDYFANGLPLEELGLNGAEAAKNMEALLRRGHERYGIFCAVCHGASGDGQGTFSRYSSAKAANLNEPRFASDQYPEGRLYHVITHGQGLMSGYGANIPVRDRWAIVAYVRALQASQSAAAAPAPEPSDPQPEPAGGAN